jgi:hypothetical protein
MNKELNASKSDNKLNKAAASENDNLAIRPLRAGSLFSKLVSTVRSPWNNLSDKQKGIAIGTGATAGALGLAAVLTRVARNRSRRDENPEVHHNLNVPRRRSLNVDPKALQKHFLWTLAMHHNGTPLHEAVWKSVAVNMKSPAAPFVYMMVDNNSARKANKT